jgi:hypothetical protein
MQRTPLDEIKSFDPETLKILTQAFDEAWPSVASRRCGYLSIQVMRDRLASIVLELGKEGERDVETLKSQALERFNQKPELEPMKVQ